MGNFLHPLREWHLSVCLPQLRCIRTGALNFSNLKSLNFSKPELFQQPDVSSSILGSTWSLEVPSYGLDWHYNSAHLFLA